MAREKRQPLLISAQLDCYCTSGDTLIYAFIYEYIYYIQQKNEELYIQMNSQIYVQKSSFMHSTPYL